MYFIQYYCFYYVLLGLLDICTQNKLVIDLFNKMGGGPRVVVSTAAFHARVRGSVPGLGGLKETKLFLPHPRVKVSIVGSLRDREVACSASDRQGSNSESCVWRTVSFQSSHHPQEVLLAQFSLYVHKGGLKPDSFHFIFSTKYDENGPFKICITPCMFVARVRKPRLLVIFRVNGKKKTPHLPHACNATDIKDEGVVYQI